MATSSWSPGQNRIPVTPSALAQVIGPPSRSGARSTRGRFGAGAAEPSLRAAGGAVESRPHVVRTRSSTRVQTVRGMRFVITPRHLVCRGSGHAAAGGALDRPDRVGDEPEAVADGLEAAGDELAHVGAVAGVQRLSLG